MPQFKDLLKTDKQREDFEKEVEKAKLELQRKEKDASTKKRTMGQN